MHQPTRIDPWFLAQIKDIVDIELWLETISLSDLLIKILLYRLKTKVLPTVVWQAVAYHR